MRHTEKEDDLEKSQPVPLWKWLLIILVVLAMPMFFSFYRNVQIQQALIETAPNAQQESPKDASLANGG